MSLTARPAGAGKPADYSRLGPPPGWRLLRRRMSLAQPLSPRLARLRAPPRRPPAGHGRRRVAPLGGRGRRARAVARRRAADPPRRALGRSVVRPHGAPRRPPRGRSTSISIATAIRETREEVGLALTHADLLGSLDDVVPRTPVLPPIAVRPFVFSLPERPALQPNPEVAAVSWVGARPPAASEHLPVGPFRHPRRAPRIPGLPGRRSRRLGHDRADPHQPLRAPAALGCARRIDPLDIRPSSRHT